MAKPSDASCIKGIGGKIIKILEKYEKEAAAGGELPFNLHILLLSLNVHITGDSDDESPRASTSKAKAKEPTATKAKGKRKAASSDDDNQDVSLPFYLLSIMTYL